MNKLAPVITLIVFLMLRPSASWAACDGVNEKRFFVGSPPDIVFTVGVPETKYIPQVWAIWSPADNGGTDCGAIARSTLPGIEVQETYSCTWATPGSCQFGPQQQVDDASGPPNVYVNLEPDHIRPVAVRYDGIAPVSAGFIEFGQQLENGNPANTLGRVNVRIVPAPSVAPTFQALGPFVHSAGPLSPAWPTHQANDVALLIVETAGTQPASLASAQGFVEVFGSPRGDNVDIGGTVLTVYWKRATGATEPAPTISDSGDHQIAQIVTFRNVATSGNPWNVTSGAATSGTTQGVFTIPGATTTIPNTLVVSIVTNNDGWEANGWTNTDLTGLVERSDGYGGSGNNGGIAIGTGVKPNAGAYGQTWGSMGTGVRQAWMSIALRPVDTDVQDFLITSSAANISGDTLALPLYASNANVFVQHYHTGTNWNHPVAATYIKPQGVPTGRWYIRNEDGATMPTGLSFVVRVDRSAARLLASQTADVNYVLIDDARSNYNPFATIVATPFSSGTHRMTHPFVIAYSYP